MQLGVIGLGRMGANIARRLMQGGHRCVVWDRSQEAVAKVAEAGAAGASDLADLTRRLDAPRAVWVMLPAGKPTEDTVMSLADELQPGDVVIDGGNTFYKDDIRRARSRKPKSLGSQPCSNRAMSFSMAATRFGRMTSAAPRPSRGATSTISMSAPVAEFGAWSAATA